MFGTWIWNNLRDTILNEANITDSADIIGSGWKVDGDYRTIYREEAWDQPSIQDGSRDYYEKKNMKDFFPEKKFPIQSKCCVSSQKNDCNMKNIRLS